MAIDEPEQLRAVTSRLRASDDPPAAYEGVAERGLGWTWLYARAPGDQRWEWHEYRINAGWPARSMTFGAVRTPSNPDFRYSPSLEPPRRLLPNADWFDYFRARIPLAPMPAGFAINALFYTAVLALPLSFFPVRRRLRARRGRCPKCGYDLAGLRGVAEKEEKTAADPAAPCPECGAAR